MQPLQILRTFTKDKTIGSNFQHWGKRTMSVFLLQGGLAKPRGRACVHPLPKTPEITQTLKKRRASLGHSDESYRTESDVDVSFEKRPNA